MNKYKERVERVITYIGQHLDDELCLEDLCAVACFSPYHFHRLFTAYTGLPLAIYIKWLRLKRAAHQLIVEKEKTVLIIALDAGFESHGAFTRAFKQACGQSPTAFRRHANWLKWESPPRQWKMKGMNMINVQIKEMGERCLAVVEHHGDPMRLSDSLDKLISWAKAQPIQLKPKAGEAFGFAYHDPKMVKPEDFRFDLALTVPHGYAVTGELEARVLPAGRYGVAMHKGPRDTIAQTIYGIYRQWLPESGEELGDLPCLFCYYNFDHEVAQTELLTEVWVLLK